MEYGTGIIDQEIELNGTTYQVDGFYTKELTYEQKDERGNTMFRESEIVFEIETVLYGEDFELTLTDSKIIDELESELYNLDQ